MGSKQVALLALCLVTIHANSIVNKAITETPGIELAENSTSIEHLTIANELANGSISDIQLSASLLEQLENNLYNSIISRNFDSAVQQTLRLYGKGYFYSIRKVANRLIDNGLPEIFDYAYKVTAARAWFIARDCFPSQIRMHEKFVLVKIINHKHGMALKYGDHEDVDGDRMVYGDPNTETRFQVTWKFFPFWHGDRVYFKVRLLNRGYFLKLGNVRDWDGDHGAFGSSNHDTNRHLWYVKPVIHDAKLLFYIINREYNEPLKLGQYVDEDGERRAYGHSNLDLNPDKYAWELEIL